MGNDARPESPGSSLPTWAQEAPIDEKLSKEVLHVLERQQEFAGGQARMINSFFGLLGFQSHIVARLLVSEARRRQSADSAVQWLQKVLHTERGEGILVRTLWGVNPTQRVRLLEDVDFLPFQSLPSSRQKEILTTDAWSPTSRFAVPSFAWNSPTAALIARVEVRPFLVDISKEQDSSTKHRADDLSRLDDVRLCLALAGPTVLIPGPSWFQYLDPDLEAAVIAASTSYSHQEVVPSHVPEAIDLDPSSASDLVKAFMALEPKLKRRIRTALARLHQALLRTSPADQALELSIALETLLVDAQGEHNFKIGLRAALLASNSIEERLQNRAVIEAAYSIRSKLMHSGETPAEFKLRDQGKRPSAEIVSQAAAITAKVIRRILTQGKLPDWRRFELSDERTI